MKFGPVLTVSLLIYIVVRSVAFAQVVDIPDPNLRAGIADALGIPRGSPITQADMRQLTGLDARERQITNLSGLQHAIHLKELVVPFNLISDLTPITSLKSLKYLDAGYCNISDITPIANLTQLTWLGLGHNTITDIGSIANLTDLIVCYLSDNYITEVNPLANLTRLELLGADINRITDITPLANLTQLNTLHINNNDITDISPLANLTQLTDLHLQNNQIGNISPLANLINLSHLELQNNRIIDIAPLANLTNLEYLDTDNNPIFDPNSPVVDIPDANLQQGIREALNIPAGVPITQAHMGQLNRLGVTRTQITNLTGLEHATHLRELEIGHNPLLSNLTPIAKLMELNYLDAGRCNISDITPLANLKNLTYLQLNHNSITDLTPLDNLTRLTVLRVEVNPITDLTPLANLTQLTRLQAESNQIADISPLANLTQLTNLYLRDNRIVDVSPLASLHTLERLEIGRNLITDHSPLDALSLTHFVYDQFCDMPPLPLEPRLANRTYPSTFGGEWLFGHDSRIDLMFGGSYLSMGFRPDGRLAGDLEYAVQKREKLMAMNPNMVFLVGIAMRAEYINHYGEDWPYWLRDADGNIVPDHTSSESAPAALMDFTHPDMQDLIVEQAIAVSRCGLFDGIVFDWWRDENDPILPVHLVGAEKEFEARLNILQRIRAEVRPNFLIQVNSNWLKIPRTGPYINGLSMETGIPKWWYSLNDDRLHQMILEAESTLLWAEENLREPHINGVVGQGIFTESANSPFNRRWVRVVTTLSLTHADGYALYQREYGDWYDFLEADLGYPVGDTAQLYEERPGLFIREFTKGWAIYNRSGKAQEITLPELATGVESGVEATTHILPNYDGEMYLRAKLKNPADVNSDGVVNILDLVVVAQAFGKDGLQGDVNEDGVVNVFDLVFVAGAIGGGGAAPSAYSLELSIISAADVAKWLALAQSLGAGDANFQRGIRFLEGLLAALTPKETTLLPNYPNPFNPETWIPYRLAREAEVKITIYDTKGTLVHRLALGNQAAGYYAERGKAAYWDGRNEDGETVASGRVCGVAADGDCEIVASGLCSVTS